MSPTVPPISVMTTSTESVARRLMRSLISSVMCGMTCTVCRGITATFPRDHALVDGAGGRIRLAVQLSSMKRS